MRETNKNQHSNNILVIGGTGKTGRRVVDRLKTRGIPVRIGSRSATPSFDWENPETWPETLNGIDAVYITYYPDLAIPGARETIERFILQAVKNGIKKLVLLSGKGEKEAELCEQAVMNSGADWTIVRASWFNQNFNESFFLDPILAGHVALPGEDALVPFVDADDIADVVVETLLNDKHAGVIYELTGPRQLTFKQITEEISNVTDRDIVYHPISLEEYEKMLKEYHVPDDVIWLITYLFKEVLLISKNAAVSDDIQKVLGRNAKDFSEYAKETAYTGIWNPEN